MNVWTLSVPPRYRRRMSPRDLDKVLDDIDEFVRRLRANGPELLARAKAETRAADASPRSLRLQPGSHSSGEGGHSDPVGDMVAELVDADDEVDILRRWAADFCEATMVARDVLRRADTAWGESVPPAQHDEEPEGGPWCVVHARYKLWVPMRSSGRCRWCNDFRADHDGRDASEIEIRALEHARIEREMRKAA